LSSDRLRRLNRMMDSANPCGTGTGGSGMGRGSWLSGCGRGFRRRRGSRGGRTAARPQQRAELRGRGCRGRRTGPAPAHGRPGAVDSVEASRRRALGACRIREGEVPDPRARWPGGRVASVCRQGCPLWEGIGVVERSGPVRRSRWRVVGAVPLVGCDGDELLPNQCGRRPTGALGAGCARR